MLRGLSFVVGSTQTPLSKKEGPANGASSASDCNLWDD
jgi:hypothetical protein